MKKRIGALLSLALVLSMTIMPFATPATPAETVTTAFQGLATDLGTVLAGVGAIAVGIMAVFLAWKYGRKLFNQVAK